MIAKYSIVQYVPDPIRDERINIGVIAFDGASIRSRFLTNWRRVQKFSGVNIDFLKDFAADLAATIGDVEDGTSPTMAIGQIEKMTKGRLNTIQLTEPHASVASVDKLLNDMAARFLTEPGHGQREYRNRHQAAGIVISSIRRALGARTAEPEVEALVKPQHELQGKLTRHTFDVVVSNGTPYFAAEGVSFELPRGDELKIVRDSVAWAIRDVRDVDKALPIGVMTLRPKRGQSAYLFKLYHETRRICEGLNAIVLTEQDVDDWVKDVTKAVIVE